MLGPPPTLNGAAVSTDDGVARYGEAFKKRRGLVPNNLLAMHANSDAIGCLLASLPEETRKGYCEACQSNVPSLESYFSSIVTCNSVVYHWNLD